MIGALVVALALTCLPPPVDAPVAEGFRAPACEWCAGHRGLRYDVAPGTVVRAVAAGEVVFAGRVAGAPWVVVRQSDGVRTSYGGLDALLVRAGQWVGARQPVGVAGGSVHLGMRLGDEYLDPATRLGTWAGRPRLVPSSGGAGRPSADRVLRCPAGARRD